MFVDNSYVAFERPNKIFNKLTSEIISLSYAGDGEFAPIIPHLMIILWGYMPPNSLGDANLKVTRSGRTHGGLHSDNSMVQTGTPCS